MGIFRKKEICAICGEATANDQTFYNIPDLPICRNCHRNRGKNHPAPMTTAEAMAEYCIVHKFNQGFDENWCRAHFQLIQNKLNRDEAVEMTFVGLHNYISLTEHQKNHAYAITGRSLYMARKNFGGEMLQSLPLQNIGKVSLQPDIAFGRMTLDTTRGELNIAIDNDHAERIFNQISEILKAGK